MGGGHRTFQIGTYGQMFKVGWDTAQNSRMFEKQEGGTPHIPIEVIWSEVQTRMGTLHKLREQMGWGHRTTMKEQIQEPGGWWVGG